MPLVERSSTSEYFAFDAYTKTKLKPTLHLVEYEPIKHYINHLAVPNLHIIESHQEGSENGS